MSMAAYAVTAVSMSSCYPERSSGSGLGHCTHNVGMLVSHATWEPKAKTAQLDAKASGLPHFTSLQGQSALHVPPYVHRHLNLQ